MQQTFTPSQVKDTQPGIQPRINFSDTTDELLIGNLIEHQNHSWQEFVDRRLDELLQTLNPIEKEIRKNDVDYKISLNFKNPKFEEPQIDDQEALLKNMTYEATLKVDVELKVNDQQKIVDTVYFGEYPWMTDRGTFIINGKERVVVTQIIRSAGAFFSEISLTSSQKLKFNSEQRIFSAKIIPDRGSWLRIETSPRDNVILLIINNKYRLPITNFLQALGMTVDDICKAFSSVDTGDIKYIEETLKHKNSVSDYQSALIEVYKCLRPGDLVSVENAKETLDNRFFNLRQYDLSKVGRYRINRRLGLNIPNTRKYHVLQLQDFIAITSEVIRLNNTPNAVGDDVDNLRNRCVKMVGELIQKNFRVGLLRLEKNIKDRIDRIDPVDVTPQQLINSRPVVAMVKTFFATSQLSQYMDQVNPLAEMAHKRRLSAMGPGGLTREYAKFAVRDSHSTHYGRICPVETSEGVNIGLVLNMALYARINEYGFLETPYYKVFNEGLAKEIVGELAGVDIKDGNGKIIVKADEKITKTISNQLEKIEAEKLWPIKARVLKDEIHYLDAEAESKVIIIGASAQFDPETGYFNRQHEEGRGQNVAGQYSVSDADYIDISTKQIIGSSANLIPFIEKDYVARALVGANQARQAVPLIAPQAPIVGTGLEKIVARYSGQFVVAERSGVVQQATADKVVVSYDKPALKKTYHPIHFRRSNHDTAINQRVVVNNGQKVKKGQPLIEGMSIERGELALGRDVLTAFMFWGGYNFEDAIVVSERLIKDDVLTSINITKYETEVRETKLGPEVTTLDIPNAAEESLRHLDESGIIRTGARVKAGDILVGKITPKGEQELSNEERLLRAIFGEKAKDVRDTSLRLPNGKSGKVIGVDIFSKDEGYALRAGVLQQIRVFIAQTRKIQIGDKLAGRHGNKGVIAQVLPVEDMPFTVEGEPVDIILNPLGVAARMNLGQLFETHLGFAAQKLNCKVVSPALNGVPPAKIRELLKQAGCDPAGKQVLYDGRTGQPFSEKVVVGQTYIYKLYHMINDKVHVRSTGPYAMITQQPLGGKAQNGGQKFGEMEVWAAEAYGAAHTLQEMLTIKSDDIYGRYKAYEAIIKQKAILNPKVPESFNVLVKELQGLCLKVDLIDRENRLVNAEEALTAELRRDDTVAAADFEMGEELALAGNADSTPEGDLYRDKELMAMLSNNAEEQEGEHKEETEVHELESGVEIEIDIDEEENEEDV